MARKKARKKSAKKVARKKKATKKKAKKKVSKKKQRMIDRLRGAKEKAKRRVKQETDVDKRHLPFRQPVTTPVANTMKSFKAYHKANPHIYRELKKLAMQLLLAGRQHYSINSLFEALRWHRAIERPQDDFKLNNIWRSWYARLLMLNEPKLRGFFFFRDSKADALLE
jgi:hypothetical protein